MEDVSIIELKESILEDNDEDAALLRNTLKDQKTSQSKSRDIPCKCKDWARYRGIHILD